MKRLLLYPYWLLFIKRVSDLCNGQPEQVSGRFCHSPRFPSLANMWTLCALNEYWSYLKVSMWGRQNTFAASTKFRKRGCSMEDFCLLCFPRLV